MLLENSLAFWGILTYLVGNVVPVPNERKRVFKFTKAGIMQNVFNSDRIDKPPISTDSTSAISCAALLMQYGPFTCMECYNLQSRCKSYDGVESADSLNGKMSSGWTFYNAESVGNATIECKKTDLGTEYRGRINVTVTGIQCQRWGDLSPHWYNNDYHDLLLQVQGPGLLLTNYCRNPDDTIGGPWCYTMDPNTRWEFCDVPKCRCYE